MSINKPFDVLLPGRTSCTIDAHNPSHRQINKNVLGDKVAKHLAEPRTVLAALAKAIKEAKIEHRMTVTSFGSSFQAYCNGVNNARVSAVQGAAMRCDGQRFCSGCVGKVAREQGSTEHVPNGQPKLNNKPFDLCGTKASGVLGCRIQYALVCQTYKGIVHLGHKSEIHMLELIRVLRITPAHGLCQM